MEDIQLERYDALAKEIQQNYAIEHALSYNQVQKETEHEVYKRN